MNRSPGVGRDWMTPDPRLLERGSRELARYLDRPEAELRAEMDEEVRSKGITVARAWDAAAPVTGEEVEAFYRSTDAYLVDLLVDHARPARDGYRKAALAALEAERVKVGGRPLRILDFGGGIGEDSIGFAGAGHAVTYVDLPGRTSAFARWRFRDRGLPVEAVQDSRTLEGGFDALFSYDVLEHVVDPPATMCEFHRLLRPGGLLLVAHSFGLVGAEYPEHLPEHEHLDNVFGRWLLPWTGFRLEGKVGPWSRLHVARRRSRPPGSSVALARPVTRLVSRLQKAAVRLRDGAAGRVAMLLLVTLAAGLMLPPSAGAQQGPYVQTDSRTDLLVERLRRSGALEDLSALTRPHRRDRVTLLVERVDTLRLTPVERGWLDELRRLLEDPESGGLRDPRAGVGIELRGRAGDHESLDPFVARPGSGFQGRALAAGVVQAGALAAGIRGGWMPLPAVDRPRQWDTDAGLRAPGFFVAATGRWAEVSLGRVPWSLGPDLPVGLTYRAGPEPLPVLSWSAGGRRLAIRHLIAPLGALGDVQRYLSLHRLEVRPNAEWEVAFTEMVLWGGVERDFELHLVNPVANLFFSQLNREGDDASVKYALDLVWRPTPRVELLGTYLLDDITGAPDYPNRHGFLVGASWAGFPPGISVEGNLTMASALLYQVDGDAEQFTYHGLGLATNRTDFLRWTVTGHWDPVSWLRLSPTVEGLRQGPRDLRTPRPQFGSPELPSFLSPSTFHSFRTGISGEASLPMGIDLRFDLSHLDTRLRRPADIPVPRSGWRGWVEMGVRHEIRWP